MLGTMFSIILFLLKIIGYLLVIVVICGLIYVIYYILTLPIRLFFGMIERQEEETHNATIRELQKKREREYWDD